MHECGIPKIMALELFKPFLYYKLEKERGKLQQQLNMQRELLRSKGLKSGIY